jgi:hypothetical protein
MKKSPEGLTSKISKNAHIRGASATHQIDRADQEGFAGLTRPQERMGFLRRETGKVRGPFDNRGGSRR